MNFCRKKSNYIIKIVSCAAMIAFGGINAYGDLEDDFTPTESKPNEETSKSSSIKNPTADSNKKNPTKLPVQKQSAPTTANGNSQPATGSQDPLQGIDAVKTPVVKKIPPAKKEPVQIKSEGATALKEQGVVLLEKNVWIKQDDMKMTADKATVNFNDATNELKQVLAEGSVKLEKFDYNTQQLIKAEGNKITYLGDKQQVILEGKARLKRGSDVLRGSRIVYDITTGVIKAEKVEGVVQSNDKKSPEK